MGAKTLWDYLFWYHNSTNTDTSNRMSTCVAVFKTVNMELDLGAPIKNNCTKNHETTEYVELITSALVKNAFSFMFGVSCKRCT